MRRRRQREDRWVVVLTARAESAVILARERLDAAGINYWVRHDTSQDLFGLGRMGTGYNFVTGPVKVLVQRDDAQEASEIVGDLAVLKSQKLPTAVGIALLVLFILFPLVLMIYEKLK